MRHFVEYLVEHAVGHLHDVVFRHAGDLLAVVLHCIFESVADDALGTGAGNQLDAMYRVGRLLVFDAGVEILFVLAHDDQIHGRVRGLHERVIADAGAHVGVQAQRLAHRDVEALIPAALRRGDGRLQQHLCTAQAFPRFGRDTGRVAHLILLLADLYRFDGDASLGFAQDFQRRFHDFGSDAVAISNGDRSEFGHKVSF